MCAEELVVAEKGLRRNPKCYGAWHHRLWVLDQGESDLQQELQLCSTMLNMDARNCQPHSHAACWPHLERVEGDATDLPPVALCAVHCWNYRRAVAARANATPEAEFAFSTSAPSPHRPAHYWSPLHSR